MSDQNAKWAGEGDLTENGYMRVTDASRMLGLHKSSLEHWLSYKGRKARMTRKQGRHRFISLQAIDRYVQTTSGRMERAAVAPLGWVRATEGCRLAGVSLNTLRRAVREGHVRAVRVGGGTYYEPDSLERYRLAFRDYPLPGWEPVRAAVCAVGADCTAACAWLRRHGHELRQYREPKSRKLAWHATRRSLDAWREYRHAFNYSRKLTPDQVRDIRRRHAAGESIPRIAADMPLSQRAVRAVANRKTYREVRDG